MNENIRNYKDIISISDFIFDKTKDTCGFTVTFSDYHVENYYLSNQHQGNIPNLNQLELKYNQIKKYLENNKAKQGAGNEKKTI